MRIFAVLPILLMASCASGVSDADHKTCRDRGLAEGAQTYAECVKQVSQERLRLWDRTNRTDMSP